MCVCVYNRCIHRPTNRKLETKWKTNIEPWPVNCDKPNKKCGAKTMNTHGGHRRKEFEMANYIKLLLSVIKLVAIEKMLQNKKFYFLFFEKRQFRFIRFILDAMLFHLFCCCCCCFLFILLIYSFFNQLMLDKCKSNRFYYYYLIAN